MNLNSVIYEKKQKNLSMIECNTVTNWSLKNHFTCIPLLHYFLIIMP